MNPIQRIMLTFSFVVLTLLLVVSNVAAKLHNQQPNTVNLTVEKTQPRDQNIHDLIKIPSITHATLNLAQLYISHIPNSSLLNLSIQSKSMNSALQSQNQLLKNTNFDSGVWEPWKIDGYPQLDPNRYYSQSYAVWLGGYDNAQDFIAQKIMIPANSTGLVLDMRTMIGSKETMTGVDKFCFDLVDEQLNGSLISGPLCDDLSTLTQDKWIHVQKEFNSAEIGALLNRRIWVVFYVITDATSISSIWLDDITLTAIVADDSAAQTFVYLPAIARDNKELPPPPTLQPTSAPTSVPTPQPKTYYSGTATMKVWYKAFGGRSARSKTYEQPVNIVIGPPVAGDHDMVENNPFSYTATTNQGMSNYGKFTITSTTRFFSQDNNFWAVFQYWWYNEQSTNLFEGKYDPNSSKYHNYNMIFTEDLSGYTLMCPAAISPGATIQIGFDGDNIETYIAGSVYDPVIAQLCVSLIDRFEITINATRE